MALNLSTLTSPATSGDVLAEALTTADFLENVPVLRNLARGSQKGGDGKQDVALNQPKALPLDANGKGYLYLSGVSGNYASVPDPLGSLGDFTMQIDGLNAGAVRPASLHTLMSQYEGAQLSFILRFSAAGEIYLDLIGSAGSESHASPAVPENTVGIRVTRVGTLITYWVDTGNGYVSHATDTGLINPLSNTSNSLEIGSFATGTTQLFYGKISRAVIWNNGTQAGTPVLDVDFTATKVRHGDTKFKCVTGQVVTINQSGNDPATVIKKSVLRFDGVNNGLRGLFANNIDGGYMFAAFSVLGNGGEAWGRVFTINLAGSGNDYSGAGTAFSLRSSDTNNLQSLVDATINIQNGMFDDSNRDILHVVKIENGSQTSRVNNAGFLPNNRTATINSDEFNIGFAETALNRAAIDLEFLALFPATITDAQADLVRNYINTRNLVFDLKDGFGYYFYDATKAPVGAISSGANAWSGRIVGSDNGDSASIEATQPTANDQPVSDGYVVTFADNSDHLDIPSTTQAGYQIVGTSLGTFVYRVDSDAVTELNLLGNFGHASFRKAGDLYGIILLPESATGADIEAARKLLIDRGAADGASSTNISNYFRGRNDIVEFGNVNLDSVTTASQLFGGSGNIQKFNVPSLPNAVVLNSAWENGALRSFTTQLPKAENLSFTWYQNTELEAFSVDLPEVTNARFAWYNCSTLSDFGTTDIKNCSNFTSAWQSCSALTSFPAGAKLGTAAASVSFTDAWQSSGLTSFSTPLPKAKSMYRAFKDCTSLTDFSSDVFANWSPSILNSSIFRGTWEGCNLTALSVQNIMSSIDSSGKFATTDGTSGGNALGGNRIDIDYNTATGSLSAATNSAVTSLKAKGWSIIVNNVTL